MPDDAKEADWRWCWQGLIAGTVATSELGKVAWSRWLNDGFGYWWVTTGGFSFFHNGERGQIIEALLSLTLALLVLDLGLDAVSQLCGSRAARLCHVLSASSLALLSAADLALFVGAGGARVSLPLVLFALQESAYVFRMVRPWLHFVLAASALLALPGILLLMAVRTRVKFHREAQSEGKRKPRWRIPQTLKLSLGGYCGWALWQIRGESEGVGADLLSQLASDLGQMLYGQLLPSETREALSLHSTSLPAEGGPPVFPPLLIFHWEAGADVLLDAANGNATPYLQRLLKRPDVFSGSAVTGVPVTLKTAWEVLCGTPASASADFREQGSALRRECLPRALRRCCNYRSVLAKTDQELPDLPRRVFGFEETIVAEDMDALLPKFLGASIWLQPTCPVSPWV
ncbi:unnamed protein product [Effrenium voratum]|uniref:Uncharacterized protein n=1 Tax=Effrenium voratum TaxID=2562239 RepID=A0AA36JFD9_9DINO|nr:unnamed protein product [Effrenium voratum]